MGPVLKKIKFNSDSDSKNQIQLQFDLTNWNGLDLPKQVPGQQWQIASWTEVLQFQLNLTNWNASDWPKQVPGQQWQVASLTKVFQLWWQHGGILGGLLAQLDYLEVAQQDAWLSPCCYYTWRHRNLKELVCRNLDSASTMSPTIQIGDKHSKCE